MGNPTDTTVDFRAFTEVGISLRRTQYWTTRGWLKPLTHNPGSGRHHRWATDEVHVARLMALLVDEGLMTPVGAAKATREGGRLATGIRILVDREDLQL